MTIRIAPTAKTDIRWPFLCLGCYEKVAVVAVVYTPRPNAIKTQLCEWCLASQGFDISDPLWRSDEQCAGAEAHDVPIDLGLLRERRTYPSYTDIISPIDT